MADTDLLIQNLRRENLLGLLYERGYVNEY